ncbi:glycoside hydrolase superfamily [Paraphysoderma sedebokerense]|nr:glycoside hydrolase superfamily [Paraphysoderma sedebokerense]
MQKLKAKTSRLCRQHKKRIIFFLVLIILIIAAASVATYFFLKKSRASLSPQSGEDGETQPLPTSGGLLNKKVTPSSSNNIYFGAHIWGNKTLYLPESPQKFNDMIGRKSAGFGIFVSVDPAKGVKELEELMNAAKATARVKGFLMVTLEPFDGFSAVTKQVEETIANIMKDINDLGVPVVLRYMHEMNGGWYPWGLQPRLFIQHWISMTQSIRAKAPLTSMMWAPNSGNSYPWVSPNDPAEGTADFQAIDTNRDGQLTRVDDPYTPYWPGAEYVDWVGVSLFWYGPFPYGNNTLPPSTRLVSVLSGQAADTASSFSALIAQRFQKPLAIVETAGVYYPESPRTATAQVTSSMIKTNWINQLTNDEAKRWGVRMVMYFDIVKREDPARQNTNGQLRDFSITYEADVLNNVKSALAQNDKNIAWIED